jgi:hypothetical protein
MSSAKNLNIELKDITVHLYTLLEVTGGFSRKV